ENNPPLTCKHAEFDCFLKPAVNSNYDTISDIGKGFAISESLVYTIVVYEKNKDVKDEGEDTCDEK
ncbi:MAG TPA: hypothetical protein DDY31_07725, partial [Lachnospiraceae bacterium]|nr:hypothetical protein [Lachnospiraceae bacterium]